MADAAEKIRESGVDGVLLGRGALGNPWIFRDKEKVRALARGEISSGDPGSAVRLEERLEILLEHSRYFEKVKGVDRFSAMRKHFGWYVKGIPHAAELRGKMFQANSTREIEEILRAHGYFH